MPNRAEGAVRRLWMLLWALAAGMLLLMLFATLAKRPFDPEAYNHFSQSVLERGRTFSREARLAGTLQSFTGLVAMLWLCFSKQGTELLRRLEAMGRGRLWLGLVAVIGGVTLLTSAVELPFSYYLGYAHEKAYGLTKQTPAQWFTDYLISLGVQMAMSLIFWLPLFWMIRRWPRRWWAPAALANIALSGFLVLIYPVVIMPLFNPLKPVTDPKVLGMIQDVAQQAGVKVDKVQLMEVSAKTKRVNAMVTGLGPTKQIILYDTLLQQFPPDEVKVVIAHELAHAVNRDVATSWMLGGGAEVATLATLAWVLRAMLGSGPLALPAVHAPRCVAVIMLFTTLSGQVLAPVQNVVSRRMEVRADRYALDVTGNPKAFISGFKRLAEGNPGDVDPPVVVEFLSHSHPSIMNRIRAAVQRQLSLTGRQHSFSLDVLERALGGNP